MGSRQAAGAFIVKVRELRRRTRDHIKDAGLTPGHGADKQAVLSLLNAALTTKLVCAQRYRQYYFASDGLLAEEIRKEFLGHSNVEQAQAVSIGKRIVQLGGDPDLDPESRLTDDGLELLISS